MLKLQIVSDLHLEFRPGDLKFLKPSAPVLCLLGDICVCGTDADYSTFIKFLEEIHDKYEKIIHVPGNHEYYAGRYSGQKISNTVDGINLKLHALKKKFKNYIFMHNNIMQLEVGKKSVYIIGTTLWTFIPVESRKLVASHINDYNMLYTADEKKKGLIRRVTPADTTAYHVRAVALIKRAVSIAKKNNIKCILLTHHKPIVDNPMTGINVCYETDQAALLNSPMVLAAHGHTHKKYYKRINGVICVSNPRGYPHERTKFDPSFTVSVKI